MDRQDGQLAETGLQSAVSLVQQPAMWWQEEIEIRLGK